jgi:hypothetical protein
MKQLLYLFLVTVTLFCQSYIYEDETAVSPMLFAGKTDNATVLGSGLSFTFFGDLDLFVGFTKSEIKSTGSLYSSSKSISSNTFGASYEFIKFSKHEFSLGFQMSNESSTVSKFAGFINYVKSETNGNRFILAGFSYLQDLRQLRLGVGLKKSYWKMNFVFQPEIFFNFPNGQKANVGFGITLIASIPYL